jgi:hypothetical protein
MKYAFVPDCFLEKLQESLTHALQKGQLNLDAAKLFRAQYNTIEHFRNSGSSAELPPPPNDALPMCTGEYPLYNTDWNRYSSLIGESFPSKRRGKLEEDRAWDVGWTGDHK